MNKKNEAAIKSLPIESQVKFWNTSIFRNLENKNYIDEIKEFKINDNIQLSDLIKVIPAEENSIKLMKLAKERMEDIETCSEFVDLINFYVKIQAPKIEHKRHFKTFLKAKSRLLFNNFDLNSILGLHPDSFQLILSILSRNEILRFSNETILQNIDYCKDKEKIYDMLNQVHRKYPDSLDLTPSVVNWLSNEVKFSPNGITYMINKSSNIERNNSFIKNYLKKYLNKNMSLEDFNAFANQFRKNKFDSLELSLKLADSLNDQVEKLLNLGSSSSRDQILCLYEEEAFLYEIINQKIESRDSNGKFKKSDLIEKGDFHRHVTKKLKNIANFLDMLNTNSNESIHCYFSIYRLINIHDRYQELEVSLTENFLRAVQLNQLFQIKFSKLEHSLLDFQFDMSNVTIENDKGYFLIISI